MDAVAVKIGRPAPAAGLDAIGQHGSTTASKSARVRVRRRRRAPDQVEELVLRPRIGRRTPPRSAARGRRAGARGGSTRSSCAAAARRGAARSSRPARRAWWGRPALRRRAAGRGPSGRPAGSKRRDAAGRADLAHQLDGPDVDAELERGRRHQRGQVARAEPGLEAEPAVLRQAAVVGRHLVLAEALGEEVRHPLGQAARVHEDERRAVRPHVRRDAIQDLAPLLVGCDRLQLAVGQLDRRGRAARRWPRSTTRHAGVPSGPLRASPAPTRRRAIASIGRCVAERPMRWGRRLASASRRSSVSARCEPRLSRATAWISSTITVRTSRRRSPAAPGGHQEVQGLGRRDQQVGRLAEHRGAGAGRRVAACGRSPQIRDDQPELARHLADLRERALEVLPDVGRERLEGRHVDDLGPEVAAGLGARPLGRAGRCRRGRRPASCRSRWARRSACRPRRRSTGQPRACGSVGPSGNRRSNQVRIAGWKPASPSIGIECTLWPRGGGLARADQARDCTRAGSGDRAARRLPQRAASGRRRPGAPIRRAGRAGAPDPGARVRLDLGRRAPRHARVSLLPLLPLLQRLAAEADGLWVGTNLILLPLHNPGRGGGDRRLPGRDHWRAVPPRRRDSATGPRSSPSSGCRWPSGSAGSARGSRSSVDSGRRTRSPITAATGASTA